MKTLLFATKNMNKLRELETLFSDVPIQLLGARDVNGPDVVEDQDTYIGNALKKAQEWFDATGIPTIADDSGLSIPALGGWPGVFTHRIANSDAEREELIFRTLGDRPRAAQAITALVFHNEKIIFSVLRKLDGVLVPGRGTNGFGFDRIFEVDGQTLAEMTAAEKNQISSRGIALQRMVQILKRSII
jgi:XTP/dITP diphosphohydrolase